MGSQHTKAPAVYLDRGLWSLLRRFNCIFDYSGMRLYSEAELAIHRLRLSPTPGEEVLATDIDPSIAVPGTLAFGIRYVIPNPVMTSARIGCSLPGEWRTARLAVYDVAGRLVHGLDPAAGAHGFVEADWDGKADSGERLASRVYFVRLEMDGTVATERVVFLR